MEQRGGHVVDPLDGGVGVLGGLIAAQQRLVVQMLDDGVEHGRAPSMG